MQIAADGFLWMNAPMYRTLNFNLLTSEFTAVAALRQLHLARGYVGFHNFFFYVMLDGSSDVYGSILLAVRRGVV